MMTHFDFSNTDAFTELTSEEQVLIEGGLFWVPFVAGAAGVLTFLELYKWGYDYASERLHNK